MDKEVKGGQGFVWTEQEIEEFKSLERDVSQLSQLVVDQIPFYKATPEIEEAFSKILSKKDLLGKAVDSLYMESKPWEILIVNNVLQWVINSSSRLFSQRDDFLAHVGFAIELLGKQLDHFQGDLREIKESDDEWRLTNGGDYLYYLAGYAVYGQDPERRKAAIQYFRENTEMVIVLAKPNPQGYSPYMNHPLLLLLYSLGEQEEKQKAKQTLLEILKTDEGPHFFSRFEPGDTVYYLTRETEADFLQIIKDEIDKYGLETDKILRPWVRKNPEDFVPFGDLHTRRRAHILDTLKNLEQLGKEKALVLQNEFGIHNFGRYPVEILERQFDRRDDTSRSYGVLLEDAFNRNEIDTLNQPVYRSMFEQLGDDFNLRITEVEGKNGPHGILRRLAQFAHRYNPEGNGHKIDFLIISGHGNREGDVILLGTEDLPFGLKTVNINDADRAARRNLKSYFEDGVEVVLTGCYLGKRFAERLSEILQGKVYGYTGSVNRLSSLEVAKEGQKTHINPEYTGVYDPTDSKDKKGDKVLFDKGTQII